MSYIRLVEPRRPIRQRRDWLQIAVGVALYVGIVLLAIGLTP